MKIPLYKILVIAVLGSILVFTGCAPQPAFDLPAAEGDPLAGSGQVDRTALTFNELTTANPGQIAPVDDSLFAIPQQAAQPSHTFQGTLRMRDSQSEVHSKIVTDTFFITRTWTGAIRLPAIDLEFIQHGSHLVPARQGLIYTGDPFFNIIVGPGRVWDETSDQGLTRASFPLTLVQRGQNCTFNGMVTFLFDQAKVSQVRYQFSQETCPYLKFDLWGQVKADYRPGKIAHAAEIIQNHISELANRLPLKPIEALTSDYPQAGIDLAGLTLTYDPAHITTYGVVVNGVHYNGGCPTRYGSYPYCENIRMASYSTAKSALAGIALMRLGQKYGPLFYTLPLRDFVPEVKNGSGDWSDVRIYHTLDMRTGMFYTKNDENSPYMDQFIHSESFNDKLAAAINFPRSVQPGIEFVYKTSDTFLGLVAMDRFYKKQEGRKADIFNLVRDEVYRPLHLSSGMMTALRTDNKEDGMPVGGLGLFWSPDDVAKIEIFLNNDRGMINGKPVLDPAKLRESFHRDRRGNFDPDNQNWYKNGFWIDKFDPAEYPQSTCEFWVTHMSGYGGITIAMLPNGINFYLFDDNNQSNWQPAVWELNKLSPVCEGR